MAPMPTPRFGLALVALDGKLYALGGSGPTGALEVYDPGSNSWSSRTSMPTHRVFLAAAAAGGRIYAVGGSDDCCGGSQTDVLEIYDPGSDSWSSGFPLPVAQQVSAAAALDDRLYVFGGFVPGSGAQDNVFVYDSQGGGWSSGEAMPTARDQAPAVSDGCSAYVPGGSIDCHCQALDAHERFRLASTEADLRITKTNDVGELLACVEPEVTYTIEVRNLGPGDVSGAVVRDVFPADLLGVTWTCAATGGATCTPVGAGDIEDDVDLPAGDSVIYTVTGTVDADAEGELCNTATVTGPVSACSGDPDPLNNEATECDPIVRFADLAIFKSNGVDEVAGCTEAAAPPYTITVENLGPCPVSGATVADDFPPELLDVGWVCPSCSPDEGTDPLLCLADLPAGGSLTCTATGVLDPAACGDLVNMATVAAPAGVDDPDLLNNKATDTDSILREADLRLTKTNGEEEVFVCEETAYTLTVENLGPCPVSDAVLRDDFPPELCAGLECVDPPEEFECSKPLPPLCGDIDCIDPLPPIEIFVTLADGDSTEIDVTGFLDPAAFGALPDLVNVAWIDPPTGGVCDPVDPDSDNNHDSDDDPIRKRAGDLEITKECTPDEVFLLSDVTCTITVTNPGPDDASGAVVVDDFPGDDLIDVTWTCAGGGGAECAPGGIGDIEDIVDLPAGSTVTYTAVATVEPWAREEICNDACVFPPTPQCFDDADSDNNCATFCIDVLPDCNGNMIDDAIDIAGGTSDDVNDDGIPDECQVGHADWTFSGLAEGGTVVVTFEGVPGLFGDCTVVTPTVAGEAPATVAANNLAALGADPCLAPRELTGMVMGATVWIDGFLLYQRYVSIEITDPGLDYDVPVVKIPALSLWGLGLMALLLAAAGAARIARRRGRAR